MFQKASLKITLRQINRDRLGPPSDFGAPLIPYLVFRTQPFAIRFSLLILAKKVYLKPESRIADL